MLRRKPYSIVYFAGICLIFFALINDVLLANSRGAFFTNYIIHIAFQIFIFLQAILLIKKWVVSFEEIEKLHRELDFKNKVFSIIAHDLRNPVANLDQFIGILSNNILSQEKREKALNSIKGMVKSSLKLIDNLLFWGRSQSSQIITNPQACNLLEITIDTLNLYKESAGNKSLSLNYSSEGDPHAFCDIELITIVIRNLISNAIKFTKPEGHVTVKIFPKSEEKGWICLDVEDDGIGIAKEKLKNIFTREVFMSTYGTANEKGTGIGLSLCFDLVILNKGTIEIESKENSGTRVRLTLPAFTEFV